MQARVLLLLAGMVLASMTVAEVESAPDLVVRGCARYAEEATMTQRPFVDVPWELWELNGGPGLDVLLATGTTKPDGPDRGCFETDPIDRLEGPTNPRDLFVKTYLCSTVACLVPDPYPKTTAVVTAPSTGSSLDMPDVCYCDPASPLHVVAARHFRDASLGYRLAIGSTTIPIPKVDIQFPCVGCHPNYLSTSYRIRIDNYGIDKPSSDTLMHEYSHHVFAALYAPYLSPVDMTSHTFCETSSVGTAFGEGFANYFGVLVNEGADSSAGGRRDRGYTFPDGTSFYPMEGPHCAGGPAGDAEETNVMRAFWDLTDASTDGLDTGLPSTTTQLFSALDHCVPSGYSAFYLTGSCTWKSEHPAQACNFMLSGEQNRIPLNQPPIATTTSQTASMWVRDFAVVRGTFVDPDNCPSGNTLEIGVTTAANCSAPDLQKDLAEGVAFDSLNTRTLPDGAFMHGCTRGKDTFGAVGPWDISTNAWRVDNAWPTATITLSRTGTSLTADWSATDAHSGLSGSYLVEWKYEPVQCFAVVLVVGVCLWHSHVDWTPACSNQKTPASTWMDSCAIAMLDGSVLGAPTGEPAWGSYCFRLRVADALMHVTTTDGSHCIDVQPV